MIAYVCEECGTFGFIDSLKTGPKVRCNYCDAEVKWVHLSEQGCAKAMSGAFMEMLPKREMTVSDLISCLSNMNLDSPVYMLGKGEEVKAVGGINIIKGVKGWNVPVLVTMGATFESHHVEVDKPGAAEGYWK